MRLLRRLFATGILLLAGAGSGTAQELRLQFRDDLSRAPVVGALVGLVRGEERSDRRLTDAAGRAVLVAPAPGFWRVRVDRIGFEPWESEPFEVGPGLATTREWRIPSLRRDLPTIVVIGESECGQRMEAGSAVAALWEEIRLALEASEVTLREGNTPLHVREFARERSESLRIERQWYTRAAAEAGQPFRSLPPAQLAREGYVQQAGGRASFHGPDAALLLSEEFLDTHCFDTRPGTDGRVGLAFAPVPSRTMPGITGTLWLDRATSELRTLEFEYVHLPPPLDVPGTGGEVRYGRLDDGSWIVREWHIRMPRLARVEVDTLGRPQMVVRPQGFLERGGIAAVTDDPASVISHATLIGQVIDSTSGAGLPGVIVELHDDRGEPETADTDEAGWFRFETRRAGDRLLVARHGKLGLAGRSATRTVLLSIGDTTRVEFGVVSLSTLVRSACGNTGNRAGVVGVALGDREVPVLDLAVRAVWRDARRTREARGRLMPDGLFGLCDLPADIPIQVQVHVRRRVLAEVEVELAPREFRWVEVRVVESKP
jgi:hypothetical protein